MAHGRCSFKGSGCVRVPAQARMFAHASTGPRHQGCQSLHVSVGAEGSQHTSSFTQSKPGPGELIRAAFHRFIPSGIRNGICYQSQVGLLLQGFLSPLLLLPRGVGVPPAHLRDPKGWPVTASNPAQLLSRPWCQTTLPCYTGTRVFCCLFFPSSPTGGPDGALETTPALPGP